MKMSKGITQEDMLSVLPGVLARDDGMYSLAKLIGWIFGENAEKAGYPAILHRIDELDDDLLDILATDYKVDWYDRDADIETKRRQIKGNWIVRKRIGTVYAVETALREVWPDSIIEEWFAYGGEPGYFRILLSVDTYGNVNFPKALRMLQVFKPVHAHLDGDPILRIHFGIVIHTASEPMHYHVPIAGTVPRYSTHGDKSHENLVLNTDAEGQGYHVPITGQATAGTHPHYTTHADQADGGLRVGASSESAGSVSRKCGTPLHSLF